MIDFGFSRNLEQLSNDDPHCTIQPENLFSFDKNTFFGSFLEIYKENNDKFYNNPFFKEMPKPDNISQNTITNSNDPYQYFGAFTTHNGSNQFSIPKLKRQSDLEKEKAFEEEYDKFIKKYPNEITDYAFNNKLSPQTEPPKEEQEEKENLFPMLVMSDYLAEDNIYNTSQIIKIPYKDNNNNYNPNLFHETCYMNIYKTINYEISLQKEYSNIIYQMQDPMDQVELYNDLIYLIEGIPSKTFIPGKYYPFTFQLSPEYLQMRLIGNLPELTRNLLSHYIDFGTKMQLIQYVLKNFLFKIDSSISLSFVLKRFYLMVNDIIIQINEKLIYYKRLLLQNKMTLISLHNQISTLFPLVNIIFTLFNFTDQRNFTYKDNIENYFSFYIELNLYQKSHVLINSLMNIFYTFQTRNNNYYLIKNLLLSSLHSYLYFIIYLVFTGEVIDSQKEYFILKSANGENDNFALDTAKVPFFLSSYKSVLLNNTILINYIKKYGEDFYNVLSYKLSDFIAFIDMNNMTAISTEMMDIFLKLRDKVFNRKIELMFEVNDKIINAIELEKNEERIQRMNRIQLIKNFLSEQEKKELFKKEKLLQRKKKLYQELQEQILEKKRRIESEILRMTNENIERQQMEIEKEQLKNEIISLLKQKYESIREKTKEIEVYGGEKQKWRIMRHNNNLKRNELMNAMFDEELIYEVYPDIDLRTIHKAENYHYINLPNNFPSNNIGLEVEDEEKEKIVDINAVDVKREDNNAMIIDEVQEEKKDIPISTSIIKKKQQKEQKVKLELPKFFICNIIKKDILMPIIDTAIDIGSKKLENESQDLRNFKKKKKFVQFSSHAKISKDVDMDILEIFYKLKMILNENEHSTFKTEIPLQTIVQEFFYDIIIKQYKITNHCFVLMLKNKYFLMHHFDFFNDIFLCQSGDLILRYIEKVFDFRSLSLKTNDPSVLTAQLKVEITKKYFPSSSENPIDFSIGNSSYNETLINSLLSSVCFEKLSNLNLNFSLSNIEMSFQTKYNAKAPLDIILNGTNVALYDKVFKKLLKHTIYNQIIVRTYSVLKNIRDGDNSDDLKFKKIMKLFFECYRTVKTVQSFIFNEIIEANWKKMRSRIGYSVDVYEIIQEHNEFLSNIYDIICNHNFIALMDNLYGIFERFYLKAIIIDYFDFSKIKNDQMFNDILDKMKRANAKIINYIRDEYVIGIFYNLKKYL